MQIQVTSLWITMLLEIVRKGIVLDKNSIKIAMTKFLHCFFKKPVKLIFSGVVFQLLENQWKHLAHAHEFLCRNQLRTEKSRMVHASTGSDKRSIGTLSRLQLRMSSYSRYLRSSLYISLLPMRKIYEGNAHSRRLLQISRLMIFIVIKCYWTHLQIMGYFCTFWQQVMNTSDNNENVYIMRRFRKEEINKCAITIPKSKHIFFVPRTSFR